MPHESQALRARMRMLMSCAEFGLCAVKFSYQHHVLLVEVVVCSSAFTCHDFFMYVRRRAAWLPGGLNGIPALDACFRPPLLGWQKRSETCFQGVGAFEALRGCMPACCCRLCSSGRHGRAAMRSACKPACIYFICILATSDAHMASEVPLYIDTLLAPGAQALLESMPEGRWGPKSICSPPI